MHFGSNSTLTCAGRKGWGEGWTWGKDINTQEHDALINLRYYQTRNTHAEYICFVHVVYARRLLVGITCMEVKVQS